MDRLRLLECIAADAARLREVAGRELTAPVPTCPDWTVADLVRHVANGYLKTRTTSSCRYCGRSYEMRRPARRTSY